MAADVFAPPGVATITGLVLAGGRGQRMGGVDKGLQPFRDQPLAAHAIARLAPQVSETLVSVCCLLATTLADALERALAEGQRKVEPWISKHAIAVPFDRAGDADAFANFNTLAESRG